MYRLDSCHIYLQRGGEQVTERSSLSVVFLVVGWPGRGEVGGGARYVYRLASELAPLVSLTIVTSAGGTPVPGAKMVFVPEWRSRLGHYYGFPFRARRILRRLQPDIIHAFGDDWALRRSSSGIVRTFLGSSLSEARSSRGARALNHYVLAALEKYAQRRADVRIGIGPESYDMFDAHRLMAPVSPLVASEARLPTSAPSITFVGTWQGRKRGWLAAEAVERARRILGQNITLTVFGPEVDRERWPEGTDYVSGASDLELQSAVQRSWLLLAPSTYEGFGIPAFEALALGVPVIATANPGSVWLDSVVGDSSAFLLVDDDDFAEAIVHRIRRGPWTPSETASSVRVSAQRIIDDASAQSLVCDVYEPLVRGAMLSEAGRTVAWTKRRDSK